VARPDEDGYVWIVGRVADSFVSHGQLVHPGDVERVLLSHPAVADAGVAPAPGAGQEQGAIAFVVVAPEAETTEQELMAWSRAHLAAHQVPAHVTFAGRLPRNSVGKLIRAELPQAAALSAQQRRTEPPSRATKPSQGGRPGSWTTSDS